MTPALLLSRPDLESLLDFGPVLDRLQRAFLAERRGEWDTPRRIAAHTHDGGLLAMPCGGGDPAALGAKLVTTFPKNSAAGLPSVSGLYALFDPRTGAPEAVMDGAYLTLVRTACVSALAARTLSSPASRSLGILGAGAQAGFHIRAFARVRAIETVSVWSRRRDQAESLIASLRGRPELAGIRSWEACDSAEAPSRCDLVVTATSATEAVLHGRWLSPHAHVTPIGAHTRHTREIDAEAVSRAARLVVETRDTLLEAGDFQRAEAEAPGQVGRVETLGDIIDAAVAGGPPARPGITIFKSCGVAFEDLAVASLVLDEARKRGAGVPFAFA